MKLKYYCLQIITEYFIFFFFAQICSKLEVLFIHTYVGILNQLYEGFSDWFDYKIIRLQCGFESLWIKYLLLKCIVNAYMGLWRYLKRLRFQIKLLLCSKTFKYKYRNRLIHWGSLFNYIIDHLLIWYCWGHKFTFIRENLHIVDIFSTIYLPTSTYQRS